jgi:hypothetical protein
MFRWFVAALAWIRLFEAVTDKGMSIDPDGATADKGMGIDPDG